MRGREEGIRKREDGKEHMHYRLQNKDINPLSTALRESHYCITRRVSRGLASILIVEEESATSLIRTLKEAPFYYRKTSKK